jgi:hypothetical protein
MPIQFHERFISLHDRFDLLKRFIAKRLDDVSIVAYCAMNAPYIAGGGRLHNDLGQARLWRFHRSIPRRHQLLLKVSTP